MDMALDMRAAEDAIAIAPKRAPSAPSHPPRPAPIERQAYAPAANRPAVFAVVAAHLVLLWALIHFDVIAVRKAAPQRLAVTMVDIAPPPPPHEQVRAARSPKGEAEVPIVATPPIVSLPTIAPPPVAVAPAPPAPVVLPPAPAAVSVPSAPVSATPSAVDIMADILDAPPPRFPVESRRLRESGTVRLRVTVSAEGRVAEVAVAQSSGHERLDAAALTAVRRWRFRPRVVAGTATEVVGIVPVTFNPPH